MGWLELLVALKDSGMSIEDIKSYTDLIRQGDKTLHERKMFLSEHKLKVEKSVAQTQLHLERIIRKMAIYDFLIDKKETK